MTVFNPTIQGGSSKYYIQVHLSTVYSGLTITATPTSGSSVSAVTDANGMATLEVKKDTTYTVTGSASGYYFSSSSVTTSSTVTDITLTCYKYPVVTVTVTDSSSSGYQSGRVITATNGSTTYSGTTNSSGVATITIQANSGTWTLGCSNLPTGGSASWSSSTVSVSAGGTYSRTMTISFGITFSMTFNATTFQTDPTGCLTYADDCAGFTPVSSPPSSLGKCGTIGSWVMSADGTSTNKLLNDCFYATFTSAGVLHEKLNPQDLTKKIATWNGSSWTSASGSSSITTEDTMFCIPTLYLSSTSSKISISTKSSSGTAYAHTIGGHTYKYLAIGVYPTNVTSSVAYSKSGANSTVSTTRPNFRTYSTGKTVKNGKAMVWNFYQWQLLRIMTIFAMKSFNGQSQIGAGGYTYGAQVSGHTNTYGPFAGSTSTSASTSNGMKAFVEDWWGHNWEFIDDFVNLSKVVYVGQNAVPDDTSSNKTSIGSFASQGFPNAISTTAISWGLGTNSSGSSTVGLCDSQYVDYSGSYLGLVGGGSFDVSGGSAGPSCLSASNALSYSAGNRGARLAFVFDT